MTWLIRIALQRPYTFIVLGILILLIGPLAILRTPIDIFPGINLPVISVIWTYNGMPPDEMSDRIITYFERQMTTTVSDIEHIESQSLPGVGVIKVFFQPNVNVNAALAQGYAWNFSDGSQAAAAGHHAAANPELQRIQRTYPAIVADQQDADRSTAIRSVQQLHPATIGSG